MGSKLQHSSAANCSINLQHIAASVRKQIAASIGSKLQHSSAESCSINLQHIAASVRKQIAASLCSILQHWSAANCSINLQHIAASVRNKLQHYSAAYWSYITLQQQQHRNNIVNWCHCHLCIAMHSVPCQPSRGEVQLALLRSSPSRRRSAGGRPLSSGDTEAMQWTPKAAASSGLWLMHVRCTLRGTCKMY